MADGKGTDLANHLAVLLRPALMQARDDPELRRSIAALGEALVALARELEQSASADVRPPEQSKPLVEQTLRIGDAEGIVAVPQGGTPSTPATEHQEAEAVEPAARYDQVSIPEPDLRLVVQRSNLKARSCRWAVERRKRIAAGADFQLDVDRTDKELVGAAKELRDCYLWMLDPRCGMLYRCLACYDFVPRAIATAGHPPGAHTGSEMLASAGFLVPF